MNIYEQVIPMRRVCLGEVEHEIKVTTIFGKYHVRVYTNGIVNQEGVCKLREHIGITADNLLRDEDKCGNISKFATFARNRLNELQKIN